MRQALNAAIVFALAAAVAFLPGGGSASQFVLQALYVLFLGAIALFGVRLYRERKLTLLSLEDRPRAALYAAIGVAVWTITATGRLWQHGIGVLVWFVLIAAASYTAFAVYRASQRY